MKPISFAASFAGALIAISTCCYSEETFSEFLKRVESRDPQTKAITSVRVSDPTGDDTLHDPKVEIKDRVAKFTVSRNYKTGNKTASFEFPVSDEVAIEVKRIETFKEVQRLASEVERAQRAYKVFVVSGYRIRLGDTLEKADREMGIPRKQPPIHATSPSFEYYEYEDGLQVSCYEGTITNVSRN